MTKFWDLESCNSTNKFSVEESACEESYRENTYRNKKGRFVVSLPKKDYGLNQLGDSKPIALKRFYGLERRFGRDATLKKLYTEFIQEYLSMGHMEQVEEGAEHLTYYMPHHAVLKPESTTTKLRVVFDASCRTSIGVALNDGLMVGPVVQDDLLSIALRFRFHRFAFSS